MRVGERIGDLHADVAHLRRMQVTGAQPVGVRALTQLHDQVRVAVGQHAGIEQVDHVRMAGHPAGGARLTHEPAPVVLVVQAAVLDLHGDIAPDRFLYRPVDGRVPAPRQHGQAGYRRGGDRGSLLVHEYENTPGGYRVGIARAHHLPVPPRPLASRRSDAPSHSLPQYTVRHWVHRESVRVRPEHTGLKVTGTRAFLSPLPSGLGTRACFCR